MNKYATISLVLIFIVLIILKVNFFWLAILAVAAAYFVRRNLQSTKQNNEEILKETAELEKSSLKLSTKEEKEELDTRPKKTERIYQEKVSSN